MKIIIAGATGFIGNAVLQRALTNNEINTIVILSRKPLPDIAANPKVKIELIDDFTTYPASALSEIRSADAAIWCVGTFNGSRQVDIEYPLAFLDIIKSRINAGQPFRYVHLGGGFTEPPPKEGEQERTLWYFVNGRRVRGEAEARVKEKGEEMGVEVVVIKPAAVVPEKGLLYKLMLLFDSLTIRESEVAAAMVDVAIHGSQERILLNAKTKEIGRKSLRK